MSRMNTIRVVLFLVAGFGVFIVYSVASAFIPRHGSVASASDLRKVYDKVGGSIAATSTNSLIQQFPFDGPIGWRIIFFKDPMVFLNGKVDTNGLRKFISGHPDTTFIWTGAGSELEEGWPSDNVCWPTTTEWTNIWFTTELVVDGYGACIEGNVDCRSRIVTFRSAGGWPVSATK
jgi:hypothetical protein